MANFLERLQPPDLKAVAAAGTYVYCYLRHKPSLAASAGTPYYIGIASSKDRPFHKNHTAPVPQNPSYIRVLRAGLDWQQACDWERLYISRYGRKNTGTGILLNLTEGGEGAKGAVRTPEQKERYRIASTGRQHSSEVKQKLRELRLGKALSDETKAKMSKSLTGIKQSPEWVERRIASHRGAKRSNETRARIREKATGRKSPSVAAANSRRVWDEAARQRHSEAMKAAAARRRQTSLS